MTYHNAHAARIDDEGIVQEVIVVPFLDDDDEKITAYCNSIGLEGTWIDTSFTGSRRGRFAGIGDRFDGETNSFISSRPEPTGEIDPIINPPGESKPS